MMRYLWLIVLLVASCGDDNSPPTMRVVNATSNPEQSVYIYWYDEAGGHLQWSDFFPPGSSACRLPEIGPAFISVSDAANIRLEESVVMQTGQHWLLRATDGPDGRATVTFTRQDGGC